MSITDDIFTMFVESVGRPGPGAVDEGVEVTTVEVMAPTENEATLTALEMVAARGRTPIAVEVDWENF